MFGRVGLQEVDQKVLVRPLSSLFDSPHGSKTVSMLVMVTIVPSRQSWGVGPESIALHRRW